MILPVASHCDIPAFVAHYKVRAYGMTVAKSTRELSVSGNSYHFDTNIASDIIFYKDKMGYDSYGSFSNAMIRPDKFDYHRERKDQKSKIDFDWKAMIAHSEKNGQKADVKIVPGTQDFISSQLLLREMLLNHQQDLQYKLVKSNKLQTYNFIMLGKQKIRTDLGNVNTIELKRIDGPRETYFWLDPDAGYLLVQSIQKRDGSTQARVYLTDYKLQHGCFFKAKTKK